MHLPRLLGRLQVGDHVHRPDPAVRRADTPCSSSSTGNCACGSLGVLRRRPDVDLGGDPGDRAGQRRLLEAVAPPGGTARASLDRQADPRRAAVAAGAAPAGRARPRRAGPANTPPRVL